MLISNQTPDSRMAIWGMRYVALRERNFRKFLFQCLKSVVGPMVGTDILMDRLRASLSKPVASWAARPMATGSMVGRRPPRLV
jgi:hypothetical protein